MIERWSFGLILLAAGLAHGQLLTPAWVEYGDNGRVLARVIVSSQTCPAITVDGAAQSMTLRQPVPADFKPVCEFALPAAARTASIGGQALHLPVAEPATIVVLGDTGCRIKNDQIQDCYDPAKWPFQAVAQSAASSHPDLIIHVGDYLYRETVCPIDAKDKCGGTTIGDNWDTWNADFFAPAAKLLAAAPWAFSRGNHEDCKRAWQGWFYYLDPRPWTNQCAEYSAPYVVHAGTRQLVMFDSSATTEDALDPDQVAHYTAQLASLHVVHAWLIDHHPFWGVTPGSNKKQSVRPLSAPLQAAWEKSTPTGIDMVLSGHVHMFAVIPFAESRPLQIIAGDGGTALAGPIRESIDGTVLQGNAVRGSQIRVEFGYTILRKSSSGAWDLMLESTSNAPIVHCALREGKAACGSGSGQ